MIFIINFTITPHNKDIIGTYTFPIPCRAPIMVCSIVINIIDIQLICNNIAPELAFGNNSSNIGFAYKSIPILQGSAISIVINKEKLILLFTSCIFPLAIAAEIAGINVTDNAILKDNGNITRVSTFPLNIPYCIWACSSDRKFFSSLTTVIASIFLFKEPKKL